MKQHFRKILGITIIMTLILAVYAMSGVRQDIAVNHNLYIKLIGPDGKIKEQREYHNLVVTVGKNTAIQQILGAASGGAQPAKFNYVGIGTNNTAEAAENTALGVEIGTRQQDTSPDFPSTGRGDIIVTFAAGNGTGAITEAGLFNGLTGPTMLARKVFAVINKGAGDTLQITWQITLN